MSLKGDRRAVPPATGRRPVRCPMGRCRCKEFAATWERLDRQRDGRRVTTHTNTSDSGNPQSWSRFHRTVEPLRLEKTSKIIQSRRWPNTTMPAKPCPEVPHLHIFWTHPGMVTPSPPWAAGSNAWPLFQ